MAEFTGVRAKGAGIEIRWEYRHEKFSRYIDKSPTPSNKADASRLRKSLIQQCQLGELVEPEDTANPTFESVCNDYLAARSKELKKSTIHGYRQNLEYHWSGLGHRHIQNIRLAHIKAEDRAAVWVSQKTRKNSISGLKQVFKFAIEEDMLHTDPSVKMKAGKFQKPEIDAFTHAEKADIIDALEGKYKLFYTLMFETGARTGELQALKWSDDMGDQLRIERSMFKGTLTTTKTHQSRNVWLTDVAKEALRSFTDSRFKKGFVFLNYQGEPFAHDRSLTRMFKKACKKAEVRYRRPYYARHTYATHGIMTGCEPGFISSQMGDRIETVLRNYAQWINDEHDQAQLAILNGKTGNKLGKQQPENSQAVD